MNAIHVPPWELLILKNAVEQTADHVMVTDKQGCIQYVNPAFERTTGYTKEEVLGKNPGILRSGRHGMAYYQALWSTILGGRTFYARTTNRKKDGTLYVADQTVSPIMDEDGRITHFVSIWKDITERARIEEDLKTEKQKMEEIVGFDEKASRIRKTDKLMDFVVSKTMHILEAGKCSVMLLDRETEELYTKAREGFEDEEPMRVKLNGSIAEYVIRQGKPLLDGALMIVPIMLQEEAIGVISVGDKHITYGQTDAFNEVDLKVLNAIAREMAVAIENVRLHKKLHHLTITDAMTSMHNYRHFVRCLDYEIKRLKRFPADMGLVMMDIDDFKSYNDQFGRQAGDALLKEVGSVIQRNLREVDVLCRYGGDEFAAVLPGTDKAGTVAVAGKIKSAVEQAAFTKPVTMSVGVAQYRSGMTRYDLTSRADRALYQAKQQGRNKIFIFGQD